MHFNELTFKLTYAYPDLGHHYGHEYTYAIIKYPSNLTVNGDNKSCVP